MESQLKEIRKHLESKRSLTAIEALHYWNCFRLSARIYDLKERGMNIRRETIEITSGGKQKRVTRYRL